MLLHKDCLICVLRPALLIGLSSSCMANFYCPHNSNVKISYFEHSLFTHLRGLLINVFFIIAFCRLIYNFDSNGDNIEKLNFVYTAWICLIFTYFDIYDHVVLDKHVNNFNGLLRLIDNRKNYGINTFLSKKICIAVNVLLFVCCCLYFFSIIFIPFIFTPHKIDPLNFIAVCSGMVFHMGLILYYLGINEVYIFMFQRCFLQIKKCLNQKLDNPRKMKKINNFDHLNLEEKLKTLNKLYQDIMKHFRVHVCIISAPHVTLLPICFVILLIVCALLVYMELEIGIFTKNQISAFDISIMVCIDLCGMTIEATRSCNVGDDIISYLFRYPISKLTYEESHQVENLLKTLTTKKPKLVASNIFTVGTNLIASISGTVVTYVLVALQFHQLSFNKD